MFTVKQIEDAHSKVKSGVDFPNYIQEIRQLGVVEFETWVNNSHTVYFGSENFKTSSLPQYEALQISNEVKTNSFIQKLKSHQKGETDYYTFCKDCADTGIEKWIVNLNQMTCIYYDKYNNKVLVEKIPH
ncbi:MAG: DUF1398 family protein [Paludibacteraceae bacterium]